MPVEHSFYAAVSNAKPLYATLFDRRYKYYRMTKEELWEENIQFYRELIDKYRFDQEPMIDLINKLDSERICQLCYPSNSHESLGLSLVYNYSERCEKPMVYITYVAKTNYFIIHYQSGQGKTVFENKTGSSLSSDDIDKIRQWLPADSNLLITITT